ncbi:hypothetical protein EDF56_101178 [Novosphingobium sp. PhB165]|uniref:hypothetical protein n=1 Tax=Novosphingobium sp. PhB165 TaxID=2485105 RepID=UPI001043A10F|nr:hypothetical protein [Novosphingobium sp. PhB165]TCM21514.1 hypothetical protein EDF56_101178 [Novosphingobium sp. PhB165]
MIRAVSITVALGAAALFGLDHWSASYMESHRAAREFAMTDAFGTAVVILGGLALSMIAFGALALILFPRPTGRPELEDHNQ